MEGEDEGLGWSDRGDGGMEGGLIKWVDRVSFK